MKLPPVIFIHGMWSTPQVWENYRPLFDAAGYETHAPVLRHHDIAPGDPPPEEIGTTSILDYATDLENLIAGLDRPPVLVGHSMGGLLAQILASRGLARAAILLTPAPPYGVFAITPSVFTIFFRIMFRWGFWRKPTFPNYRIVRWGILHEISEEDAQLVFDEMVWESGRATSEIAYWPLDQRKAAAAPPEKLTCPLLLIAGSKDRITPASVCRKTARRYKQTEYVELPQHAHWVLGEPGWEKIADRCVEWVREKC